MARVKKTVSQETVEQEVLEKEPIDKPKRKTVEVIRAFVFKGTIQDIGTTISVSDFTDEELAHYSDCLALD